MLNTISPFCTEAVEKDAAAFANVMGHIREQDEEDSTVIAVQIENEVGLLGTAYDVCDAAREAFEKKVPEEKCGGQFKLFRKARRGICLAGKQRSGEDHHHQNAFKSNTQRWRKYQ